jgi:cysteinyl-tRNA synthetase
MSLKFLDGQLDVHCGGIDHINVHHTNEIAQAEAATGEKFFNYWLHGAFLNIAGGKKMAKSEDNFLTLKKAFLDKGINPLAYRFAALSVHYRKPMEYSEESVINADNSLKSLYRQVGELGSGRGQVARDFKDRFLEAINDDLNTPRALAVAQELLRSDLPKEDKAATILDFDKVLGLGLDTLGQKEELPPEITELVKARQSAKQARDWDLSDALRAEIERHGYTVEDTKSGTKLTKR